MTGYVAEISPPPGGAAMQDLGVTTSTAFTGLTNGTTYTFNVMAPSIAGAGAGSAGSPRSRSENR